MVEVSLSCHSPSTRIPLRPGRTALLYCCISCFLICSVCSHPFLLLPLPIPAFSTPTASVAAACDAVAGEDCLAPLLAACPALARVGADSQQVAVLGDGRAASVCRIACAREACKVS